MSYIMISDFSSREQVLKMWDVCHPNYRMYHNSHKLGVGVMMTWKTLNDQPTKWANVFPKKEAIADIFLSHRDPWRIERNVFNVLHYADYEDHPILENLEKAFRWCGENLDGLQLDMIWPDPNKVQEFHWRHPRIKIILQVNANALDAVGNDPKKLVERLKNYNDSIAYALLDKSMGRGLGMDAEALLPFATAIEKANKEGHLHYLGIAAAGGLGPDTLHLAGPLIAKFPGISLDAQSKLRPSGNALDPLDLNFCTRYLEEAAKHFGRVTT